MSEITLSEFTLYPSCDIPTDVGTIRAYYDRPFLSDGLSVVGSSTFSDNFFNEFAWAKDPVTGLLTAESSSIITTVNSSQPDANLTLTVYDSDGTSYQSVYVYSGPVPNSLGSTVTLSELQTYVDALNVTPPTPRDSSWVDVVDSLIQDALGSRNYAGVNTLGLVYTNNTPTLANHPTAVLADSRVVSDFFNITAYPYLASTSKTAAQNATAVAAAVVAAGTAGAGIYVPVGTFLINSTAITVPVMFAPGGSILDVATGQTLQFTKAITLDASKHFGGTGTVSISIGPVRPDWWIANTPDVTDMTAGFLAAAAALPSTGGKILLQGLTYLVTSWSPTKAGLVVEGSGVTSTSIKGSGAGDYTVRFNALSRTHWKDLAIDGGGVKTAAMQMDHGPTSSNLFENVRWKGGATNSLVMGTASSGEDISDNTWEGCTIQSDSATGAQLKYRGNDVSSNIMTGGRISTGNGNTAATVALDMNDGSSLTLNGVNLLGAAASGTFVVTKTSSVLKMISGHLEGAGGIHTLSTDPRMDESTPPDFIKGVSFATSEVAIYHEAPRTMIVEGVRAGGNIRIGTTARLEGKGNVFSPGGSYVLEGNAELVGADAAKASSVLAENNKLADTFLYSVASAANKISGLWLFDEDGSTTTITDRGTLSHNLTLSSAANLLTPKNRGLAPSLLFSTSPSNYWLTPDSDDFSFGNGVSDTPFTFMVIIQPTSLGATINTLFGKYNSSTASGEYLFSINSGKLTVLLSDQSTSGTIGRLYNTSLSADVGSVHVYAATYSGTSLATGIKLYRDGVRVDDTDNSGGVYVAMENTTDVPGDFTFAPGRLAGNARNFGCMIVKEAWTAAQVSRGTKLLQGHASVS